MKYSFKNDYSTGCHEQILKAIINGNTTVDEGYGLDRYSLEASKIIGEKVGGKPSVFLVSGGTQANLCVIAAILRPYESVIAAQTAHIQVHETGAIEATGHRIQVVVTNDGKLRAEDIRKQLALFEAVHTTMPRMVYISNSTEIGTIYSRAELVELSECCKANGLLLFLDGARLSAALSAIDNDISFEDLGKYTDVFYIGGTKSGALLGEAIVFNNQDISGQFAYVLKQRGALLAKGRILGIQFLELFKDDLYLELGKRANTMAARLSSSISEMGFDFLSKTSTNQIFPILPNHIIQSLSPDYAFYTWQKIDAHVSAIRLVTSWDTKDEAVESFLADLKKIIERTKVL